MRLLIIGLGAILRLLIIGLGDLLLSPIIGGRFFVGSGHAKPFGSGS